VGKGAQRGFDEVGEVGLVYVGRRIGGIVVMGVEIAKIFNRQDGVEAVFPEGQVVAAAVWIVVDIWDRLQGRRQPSAKAGPSPVSRRWLL
jgi:hypothetical protein